VRVKDSAQLIIPPIAIVGILSWASGVCIMNSVSSESYAKLFDELGDMMHGLGDDNTAKILWNTSDDLYSESSDSKVNAVIFLIIAIITSVISVLWVRFSLQRRHVLPSADELKLVES